VIGRLTSPTRKPISNMRLEAKLGWFETGTDGLFAFCREVRNETSIFVVKRRDNSWPIGRFSRYLVDSLTVIAVQLDTASGKPPSVPPR
jgi:hypothetical protein